MQKPENVMTVPEKTARWLMDGDGATDEEFAETFVLMAKIKKGQSGAPVSLTKEDMTGADTEEIASMIKNMLDEILFSTEIDSGTWWKG